MPSDDADRINYKGEVRVLNLLQEVVAKLDHEASLTFVNLGGMGMPKDFMSRMGEHYKRIAERKSLKGKLGVRTGAVVGNGLAVASVREGNAAEKAGLQEGDVLLRVNGRNTMDMASLRRALASGLKGEQVTMKVQRGDKTVELTATLQ